MNFTVYDGISYEGGPTEVTLSDGQHVYVYVDVVMKLEKN